MIKRVHTLLSIAFCALSASPALATWSIVVTNSKTGEVCVAAATCLPNFNLIVKLPVVTVGKGAGVSQGLIDLGAIHRQMVKAGLAAGDTPSQIITTLTTTGSSVQQRQWGVVDLFNDPATFSGSGLGLAHHGVTGVVGDLRYAIQGNVITDAVVVTDAEAALLNTPGDLSQKVMAAMQAARAMGGDGRCSCLTGSASSCGAPPPGFTKSSHCSFIVLARMGDTDSACLGGPGCANGSYHLRLENKGDWNDIDTVAQLQIDYDAWRVGLSGRPDNLLSTVTAAASALVADGLTSTDVTVRLVDVDGIPLSQGGAILTVTEVGDGVAHAVPGAVIDHGDGSYTLPFTAGTVAGSDTFAIKVDDGTISPTLYPYLELDVDPLVDLHLGVDSLSASAGGSAPFVVNLGAAAAGHPYILLGGVSGTQPGTDLGSAILPLNADWFLNSTVLYAGSAVLPGSIGALDAGGRAQAAFDVPPGLLWGLLGLTVDWAALDYLWPYTPTSPVGLIVGP